MAQLHRCLTVCADTLPPPLSAARWGRLRALIQQRDQPPHPDASPEEAYQVLQALLYGALTGVAWQDLPAWAPPAAVVASTYARWQRLGLLAQLSDDLRITL